jgi:hypothetical protein
VSSIEIFVSTATLLAYTLPFILHVSTSVLVAKMGSEKDKDLKSTIDWQENADKKKNESENDGDDITGSTVESHTVTGMDTLPVNDKWHFNAHPLLFFIYLLLSLEATNLIYSRRLCHNVLEFVSLRDPSSEQQIAACVTLWSTFVALMCLAFYRNATLPRT